LKDEPIDEAFEKKLLKYVHRADGKIPGLFPDPETQQGKVTEVIEKVKEARGADAAEEEGADEEESTQKREKKEKKRESDTEEAKKKGRKKEAARTSASSSSAASAPSASEKGKRKSRDEDAGSQCIDLLRAFLGPILSRPGSLVSLEFFLLLSCGCMRFIFVCLIVLL
jgi:outer membrane biosynthesis protein TonB